MGFPFQMPKRVTGGLTVIPVEPTKSIEVNQLVLDAAKIAKQSEEITKQVAEPNLPSTMQMVKNLAAAAKETAQYFIKTGQLNRTPEEVNRILAICRSCDKYRHSDQRCSLCGCFMKFKTSLSSQHCYLPDPHKKW